MAHVTFIHGMSNKPSKSKLLSIWHEALASNNGIDLSTDGVTSSMVYWADVLYGAPVEDTSLESARLLENQADLAAQPTSVDPDMSWRQGLIGEEKRVVDALAAKLNFDVLNDDTFTPSESEIDRQLERIPLPWFVKRRIMKEFLRDVHHYLFNAIFEPRPGERYQVQDEIRRRTIAALEAGSEKSRPHIVVSHSMGTVIAYDCLKRVSHCQTVDGLMTIGSPLGIDEVQDKLEPEWNRENGFPTKVTGAWVNIYDSLDPVTGFDGDIANDFKKNDEEVMKIINEQNWGHWRHDLVKYFSGSKLRESLSGLLNL